MESFSNVKKVVNGSPSAKSINKLLSSNILNIIPKKIEFVRGVKKDVEIDILKSKYNPLSSKISVNQNSAMVKPFKSNMKEGKIDEDDLVLSKYEISSEGEAMELHEWKKVNGIGSGLNNEGNTCFLNSVLQCLSYTSPLANYSFSKSHSATCKKGNGFCLFCIMESHINLSFKNSNGSISPKSFIRNLKAISPTLRFGRQEDSHEFLRCVIDGMQKSCLHTLPKNLDSKVAETSIIHRIFGGYLQSQVLCSECGYKSNTFDPFLDLSLEINGCDSVEKAFKKFTSPETLDNENKYKCPRCSKKVRATKRFTIKKTPNILTIQLKRFKFGFGGFGGNKINKKISFPERLGIKPFLSQSNENANYKLYAVLVHSGHSINSGHYYCYIKNSADIWYCMNDSSVSKSSINQVLNQEAYILFYSRDISSIPKPLSQKRKAEDSKEAADSNNNNANGFDTIQHGKEKLMSTPKRQKLEVVPVLTSSSPKVKLDKSSDEISNGSPKVSKASVPIMRKLDSEFSKNKKKTEEFLNSISLEKLEKDLKKSDENSAENSKKKSKKNPNDNSSVNANSISGSSDEDTNQRTKLKSSNQEESNSDDTTDSQDSNINMPLRQSSSESISSTPNSENISSPKIKKQKKVDSGVVASWDDSLNEGWKSENFDDQSFSKKRAITKALTSTDQVDTWDEDPQSKAKAKKLAIEKEIQQEENKLKKKYKFDEWDEMLDSGKVRKVKERKIIDESLPNEFQNFSNKSKMNATSTRKIGYKFKKKIDTKTTLMNLKSKFLKTKRNKF